MSIGVHVGVCADIDEDGTSILCSFNCVTI